MLTYKLRYWLLSWFDPPESSGPDAFWLSWQSPV
jgi:hypothetical protein